MSGLPVGLALVALLIAAGCGGSDEPKVFDVAGTLTLKQVGLEMVDGELAGAPEGVACAGTKGYDDIAAGAQVVIRDAGGKDVGLGELGPGERSEIGWCEFAVSVPDVPAGDGIYSIEVSHRGKVSFKPAGADSIALTLG